MGSCFNSGKERVVAFTGDLSCIGIDDQLGVILTHFSGRDYINCDPILLKSFWQELSVFWMGVYVVVVFDWLIVFFLAQCDE